MKNPLHVLSKDKFKVKVFSISFEGQGQDENFSLCPLEGHSQDENFSLCPLEGKGQDEKFSLGP